jgi:hypothetical protein
MFEDGEPLFEVGSGSRSGSIGDSLAKTMNNNNAKSPSL